MKGEDVRNTAFAMPLCRAVLSDQSAALQEDE